MATISLNGSATAPLHPGQDLLGALLDAGLPAVYICMSGSCGRCRVRVSAGGDALSQPSRAEQYHRCADDHRLACQARLERDADVAVHQPA